MESKFYMCYVEDSRGCSYIHPSLEDARTEAERLTKMPGNEGKRVYIMESIQFCQVEYPPVNWHIM